MLSIIFKSQAFLHGLIFVCLGYRGVLLFHVILKYRNGFSKNQSKYSYPPESIYSVPNTQLGKRDTSETEFTLLSFDITATMIMIIQKTAGIDLESVCCKKRLKINPDQLLV